MRLCDDGHPVVTSRAPGQLSFCETIAALDAQPQRAGLRPHDRVLQRPRQVRLAEAGRAVRRAERRDLLARTISPTTSRSTTARCASRRWPTSTAGARSTTKPIAWQSSAGTTGSPRRPCGSCPTSAAASIDTDMFTPTTIVRFTGHDNGAVYGAPEKQLDGTHALEEPVHLRHRPRLRRHHRQHHQRHRDGQPASV